MSQITNRPARRPVSRAQALAFLDMAEARRAFIEAWDAWIKTGQPTADEVREEADATVNQVRQIVAFHRRGGGA